MLFDRRWAPKSINDNITPCYPVNGHLFNLLFFFLSRSDTVAIRSADSRTEGNFLGSTGTLLFIASSGWWTLGISQFSRWIQPGGQPYSAQITEWTAKLNLNALTMCLI
ncbi:hypothetical protein LENED_010406 [Lentinula edodes]|uniref:Uncharacterized protein n=1 Tax=Lentinula edodes TaxID=5353 RepID=A0A1Q3EMB9_LENED|nr:hypothetical protein LENED_010406 [Lentinula edodes]